MTRRKPSGQWLWAGLVVVYMLMSVDSVAQIVRAANPWGGLVLFGASILFAMLSAAGYRWFSRPTALKPPHSDSREDVSAAENRMLAELESRTLFSSAGQRDTQQ